MDRPGLKALIQSIRSGAVKVVLVYKLERIVRSTDDWGQLRVLLKDHNCLLVSASEGQCEDTPSGRLRNHLLVSVAEYERLNTAEKVKTKMLEQAKRGMWNCGQIPFGYTYDPAMKLLMRHHEEAAIVARIFDEAAQLVRIDDIADALGRDGVCTRVRVMRRRDGSRESVGGQPFRREALRSLIRNPIYVGRIRFQKREYPGKHVAIVTPEVWDRANAALEPVNAQLHRTARRADKHFNLLKDIVHCGSCGHPMVPNASGRRDISGRLYRYYVCSYRREQGQESPECGVRHVAADMLEAVVIEFIGMCARHPSILSMAVQTNSERSGSVRNKLHQEIDRIRAEITSIDEGIRRCLDALSSGRFKVLEQEIGEWAERLKREKPKLLVEHERLRQQLRDDEKNILDADRLREVLGQMHKLFDSLRPPERKTLVSHIIQRLEVHRSKPKPAGDSRREFELYIYLKLKSLAEGMADHLVMPALPQYDRFRRGGVTVMKIRFGFTSGSVSGSVVILSPMRAEVLSPGRKSRVPEATPRRINPMRRALEWQRQLATNPGLTRVRLAKREKVTPGTITHHFKLLKLTSEIQSFVLKIESDILLRRFSLNRLKEWAELPRAEQMRLFAELK